jgi:ABC-type multidrug transport system fused ATPase/permease subunit
MLRALADLFPGRERLRLAGMMAASAVAAMFETIGVATILPFMSLVTNPASLDNYPTLVGWMGSIGVMTQREMLLVLGGLTLCVIAFGNIAAAINVALLERFIAHTKSRLAASLFAGYLRQPYAFHVRRDGPSILKVLVGDMSIVVYEVIGPLLMITSRTPLAIGILILLFVQDPMLSLSVGVLLGSAYVGVFWAVTRAERQLGVVFNRLNLERQRVGQEAIGGIKELQGLGREQFTIERYTRAAIGAARAEARNRTNAQMPRYGLETIAFGGILLILLVQVARGNDAQAMVPTLALFAFAGYRLLPALQYIYAAALSLRFSMPTLLSGIHEDFVQVVRNTPRMDAETVPPSSMPFASAIRVENVTFAYESRPTPVLRDVSLTIPANESLGLVGRTGSGKTTLADLILGFYEPSSGQITVDGVPLTGPAVRQWRRRVGYVPQHVFLANATVTENIAFGLDPSAVDESAIRKAAHLAQAEEFIVGLPHGFNTVIGERGVKLSGGQRQRIGIARALYSEPALLVFDEATSALDGLTEDAVMDAIRSLRGERTIILIAHRLRTVEACDQIAMLEHGRVVAQGTYASLLSSSEEFARFLGGSLSEASGPHAGR